jgi:hypothetical protein
MQSSTFLRSAAIAAFAYALVALAILIARTLSQGVRPVCARPEGSARQGVFYAFFKGMLPWEKESVAAHVPTFVAGLLYHAGVFLSLLFLLLLVLGLQPRVLLSQSLRVFIPVGFISGVGLLMKRLTSWKMKLISVPDDFLANAIVSLFLATAFAATMSAAFTPAFFAIAAVLFLYMPLGKIRHCVFFFYTRIVFGVFFGRRGVLPQPRGES